MLQLGFIDNIFSFMILMLGLGFVIFVHELGHFLIAKWCSVKVEKFAIGFDFFGLKLGQWTRGETTYVIGAFPLGGYVKMLGQDDMDPTNLSSDPRAYNNRPISQRFAIISGGVVMNAIFGCLFFIVAFYFGIQMPAPIVGPIAADSPAARAVGQKLTAGATSQTATGTAPIVGLKLGDRILSIDGKPIKDAPGIMLASVLGGGKTSNMIVQRPVPGGRYEALEFKITPESQPGTGFYTFGISPCPSLQLASAEELKQAPILKAMAEQFDKILGTRVTQVNGRPVDSYWAFHRALNQSRRAEALIESESPDGQRHKATVSLIPQTDIQSQWLGVGIATQVQAVMPHSIAEGKLKAGDVIEQLEDIAYPSLKQVYDRIKQLREDNQPLRVRILREGAAQSFTFELNGRPLGILMTPAWQHPICRDVAPTSPFHDAGVKPKAVIQAINGQNIGSFSEAQGLIKSHSGQPMTVTYVNPGQPPATEPLSITKAQAGQLHWQSQMTPLFQVQTITLQATNPIQAMGLGFFKTWSMVVMTYKTLIRVGQGSVKAKNLQGIVGIAHHGTMIAGQSWTQFIFFLGIISVNLAVVNFLPFPVVDGGHAILLLLEKVRGKPVPLQVQYVMNTIGLVLIGFVFLYVTYYDVLRLLGMEI